MNATISSKGLVFKDFIVCMISSLKGFWKIVLPLPLLSVPFTIVFSLFWLRQPFEFCVLETLAWLSESRSLEKYMLLCLLVHGKMYILSYNSSCTTFLTLFLGLYFDFERFLLRFFGSTSVLIKFVIFFCHAGVSLWHTGLPAPESSRNNVYNIQCWTDFNELKRSSTDPFNFWNVKCIKNKVVVKNKNSTNCWNLPNFNNRCPTNKCPASMTYSWQFYDSLTWLE